MKKKEIKNEKEKLNKNESLYSPVIYELEQNDLNLSRDILEFLAANGDILTQPIFTDMEYKKLLKELSTQIQNKEILFFPHGSKNELKSCLALFFDSHKFETLIDILTFYKKIMATDSDLENEFSHYLNFEK